MMMVGVASIYFPPCALKAAFIQISGSISVNIIDVSVADEGILFYASDSAIF